MTINIIAAVDRNRAIGYQNKLLYWLPNDLKHFKKLTTGHTIIMGRKTFDSLPHGALPNRRNIVLSRSQKQIEGCEVYASLEEAIQACTADEEVFIIGGSSVYRQAMTVAHRLCLTEVDDKALHADAWFPAYDEGWVVESREDHPIDERHAYRYSFVDYVRTPQSA